ncbi:MAG: LytTR family transcriptional regulator DNA-binding domain-containing protein [Clostridia bacterium]|nr:LytTR family transcriptional regulator DNA-binding domain-containing protein [Clostridia bacterium]MBQ6961238.1 LytTR family transcriptional regulator DNA-binding domain-containing protein [Clostridia bacterium]
MRVRFEQVDAKEKEQALIRAVEKTADIMNAMDLLENGSGGVTVTKDRNTYFCKLTQIYYIESVDKHTYLYTKGDCYESRERLYELEEKLGLYYVRISKSMIVNLRKIQNVSAEPGGRMVAVLLNGERVIISRSYVKEIKRRLGIQ